MPHKNVIDGFWLRQQELISSQDLLELQKKRILFAGLGANGSISCETMVRMGIMNLVIADPDIVEINNLNRQNYEFKDIGHKKVKALARRLIAINPTLKLQVIESGVTLKNCDRLVKESDIVMDACDDYAIKVLLSRHSQKNNKPLIHHSGGAYRGAVTVFYGDHCYEDFFELPTMGIPDHDLFTIDFSAHKRKVLENFGAELFSTEKMEDIAQSKKLIWPTMAGACDIAGAIASMQAILVLRGIYNKVIYAPEVLLFDIIDLNFSKLDYSIKENRIYKSY